MGNPEQSEPTPERENLTPERRAARNRRAAVAATGVAAVLVGGAFLAVRERDARQESLPESPSTAAASASTPDPVVPDDSPTVASTSARPTQVSGPTPTGENAPKAAGGAATKRSSKTAHEEIDRARAKAAADGFPLQRPPEAKDNSAAMAGASAVTQWTESIKGGNVRVTTAHSDLTGGTALVLAADRGQPVGDGVSCTDKIRFTRDAPATEQPTVLLCWRTSSARSVVTMMAKPNGRPSAAANVSIINREWAKLG